MLRPRLIPCLLLRERGLVKTIKFSDEKYVGDPLNAVRIFNEKEADELIVLDIDATKQGKRPDFELIGQLASECRMPLCYGGGIRSRDDAEKIIALGVEKVAFGAAAVESPQLLKEVSESIGAQSVVAVMDVRRTGLMRKFGVFIRNGTQGVGMDPLKFALTAQASGAGEILINNIDRDGMQNGYDLDLIGSILKSTSLPVTAIGGAGCIGDIEILVKNFGPVGCGAGSFFVFKGSRRAVLINYPDRDIRDDLAACISAGKQ